MPTTPSPLRYPGGKTKLYLYVRELLKNNSLLGETYIEPFAGGAGLALKLLLNNDVKRIIINDIDLAIYAFWTSILNETDAFCELILGATVSPEEWQHQRRIYLQQDTRDPLALGFAAFYLNRTNVSGIIMGGIIGGQSQAGKYKMDARFNKDNLIKKIWSIAACRDRIIVSNLDARELLKPETLGHYYKVFINFDPPYVRKGDQLYKNSFTEFDHKQLCEVIARCRRKWIVTYDICPLITRLYTTIRHSFLDVTYSVQGSQKAKEYIFFSQNLIIPEGFLLHPSVSGFEEKDKGSRL